jgi:hypothetical protein
MLMTRKDMNTLRTHSLRKAARLLACGITFTACLGPLVQAQTITNPSFEANSYSVAPGLISDNTAITGWTADNPAGAGLNPAGGTSTYADNGTVPDGKNVAFVLGGTTLSTSIGGLTVGQVYKVQFQANAMSNTLPVMRVSIDGTELLGLNIYTAGVGPYGYIAFEFTAAAASQTMSILNDADVSTALLLDNFSVALSSGRWKDAEWTDDASSGIDSQYVYTHAYNFGTANNVVVNGVAFTGVAGANPKASGKFSTVFLPNVYNGDANNITGSSAGLAKDFCYSGANVTAGSFETLTINGLTPGTEYVATIYTCGWDDPSPTTRWATASFGEDRLTFNQDAPGNNNGSTLSYRYTAGTNGTAVIKIAPVNPVNVSIHMYGFSNRESASRNAAPAITLQPAGTTVSQGLPVTLIAAASGFPTPTYQWRMNGTNITGATTATNAIAATTPQTAGLYDVIAKNSLGSATSVVARVVVGLPMNNPSFEADSFVSWPGYSGANNPGSATTPAGANVPITGWTQSDLTAGGINPTADGSSPFADNGAIPNGKQVAFIQGDSTLLQTVSGLSAGGQFYVHYYENARSGGTPGLAVQFGTNVVIASHEVTTVGGVNPYHEIYSDMQTATGTSVDLTFVKSSPVGGDNTVLIDNVAIVPVPAGTAPIIVADPQSAQLVAGKTNTLSVRFVGSLPVTYKWFKDGKEITGQTGPTLTLSNVTSNDQGGYYAVVSNSGGNATSASAQITVISVVPTVFGTGVGADGNLLAAGSVDPHYKITTSPDTDFPGPDAQVLNDAWPVAAGVWLLNGPDSKWIAPQADQSTGNAEGDYVYETTFDLTGYDLKTISLVGQWAVDNSGTDIVLNGTSLGLTTPGFNAFTPFTITSGFLPGKNTLDFKVNNLPATPNPTGLRVDLKGVIGSAAPVDVKLQISRSGSNITISWPATPAGQKLQSSTDLKTWKEITGASNPYTTTATGTDMFFRTQR